MEIEYKDIERDKDGFATDECLSQMHKNLPILVFYCYEGIYPTIEYIDEDNWHDSVNDIESRPQWRYWQPTVALPEDAFT